jgi:signal transduction histidine kinase
MAYDIILIFLPSRNTIDHPVFNQGLYHQKKDIVFTIADNGKGDANSNEKRGVGIINIKSRVALCNGTVTVATAPGKGYELKVLMPLLAE